jgi:hypothetical protein
VPVAEFVQQQHDCDDGISPSQSRRMSRAFAQLAYVSAVCWTELSLSIQLLTALRRLTTVCSGIAVVKRYLALAQLLLA